MEIPIKMDDLVGPPLFLETPIYIYIKSSPKKRVLWNPQGFNRHVIESGMENPGSNPYDRFGMGLDHQYPMGRRLDS